MGAPKQLKPLDKTERSRQKRILGIFQEIYPEPRSELNFKDAFQLIVAVSLSAQCTDKKVNEVTPQLFAKYPDFVSLSTAKIEHLEKILRPVNYYRTKSKNIRAMAAAVVGQFAGVPPMKHELLITLPGVGRKTANVVLSELKISPAIPVDTHVFRVSKRLGFSDGKNPVEVEKDLQHRFQPSQWYNLHHWLIFHGRRVCKAQRPLCEECPLTRLCPFYLDNAKPKPTR